MSGEKFARFIDRLESLSARELFEAIEAAMELERYHQAWLLAYRGFVKFSPGMMFFQEMSRIAGFLVPVPSDRRIKEFREIAPSVGVEFEFDSFKSFVAGVMSRLREDILNSCDRGEE